MNHVSKDLDGIDALFDQNDDDLSNLSNNTAYYMPQSASAAKHGSDWTFFPRLRQKVHTDLCFGRDLYKRSQSLSRMAVLALSTVSCGVAASTSYEIGKGTPQCEYLAAALKKARIADMTGAQLCETQQKPIEQWLKAEHIHDLAWDPYPATDPMQLEKSMIESTISEKDLPKFSKGISNSLKVMKKLSDDNNLFFQTAPLNFSGQYIYVLQLQQKRCPNVNGRSDTWIDNGLFLDKDLQRGVGRSLLMSGGVISFFGEPATLSISERSPDAKRPEGIDVQLSPIIWDPKAAAGAGTRVECQVFIPSDVSMNKEITRG